MHEHLPAPSSPRPRSTTLRTPIEAIRLDFIVRTGVRLSQAQIQPQGIAGRIGTWSAQNKKKVLLGWILFVVLSVVGGSMVKSNELTDADSFAGESGRAEKTLEKQFPEAAVAGELLLVNSKTDTAGSPQFKAAIKDIADTVGAVPVVTRLQTPATQDGLVSDDRHSAMVTFEIKGKKEDASTKIEPVKAAVKEAQAAHPELRIEQFGDASVGAEMDKWIQNDLHKAETMSVPITLIILLIAFGAIVAAGVPVLFAASAVIATVGLISIPSLLFPVDQYVAILVTLIGMAVGVDYSLFYLRREREERAKGHDEASAIAIASSTSGRTILISGVTVMAAMSGQFLTGDASGTSNAVGTIMVVAVAMLGSLTALPAMLALLGRHVDKGRLRIPARRKNKSTRPEIRDSRMWGFILDRVLKRPALSALAAVALLLVIASPALHFKIHQTGTNDLPPDMPGYTVLQHMNDAFPSNNANATVVVTAPNVNTPEVKQGIANLEKAAEMSGQVTPPFDTRISKDGTVAAVDMQLVGTGDNQASKDALKTLRNEVIPSTVGKLPGVEANVSGSTAINEDSSARLAETAPLIFGFVLMLAFVLMLVTFRSIVVPIKAIILNLLSVAAAYGVLVWVFQDGHGSSLLNFAPTGGVTPWLPTFLFVILFGLSMDYHVFILSRVKELVDGGMSTEDAVTQGIKSTAGVVTGAAAVMVAVFGIFATLSLVDLKEFGVGLAVAVFLDATIIRGVLLPASMKLLGEANWWLPKPLRWLPEFRHEAAPAPSTEGAG
jgi:putative drug exporter of the RND superfamily